MKVDFFIVMYENIMIIISICLVAVLFFSYFHKNYTLKNDKINRLNDNLHRIDIIGSNINTIIIIIVGIIVLLYSTS